MKPDSCGATAAVTVVVLLIIQNDISDCMFKINAITINCTRLEGFFFSQRVVSHFIHFILRLN